MSATTATDPVDALLDLLAGTADADWTNAGAKPEFVERQETSSQTVKGNRSADAIYAYRSADTSMTPLGAEVARVFEEHVVTVDVWTITSATHAEALGDDLKRLLFQYANDNKTTTPFGRIRPETMNDVRSEKIPTQGDHYREIFGVRLRALRDPATY